MSTTKVAINTGRSIKNATTPAEVFKALVSHITAPGAIAEVGDYVKDCATTMRPMGFMQTNGKLKYSARTNKFTPAVSDAVKALAGKILSMSLEDAKQAAYNLQDTYGIVLNIWEDAEDLNAYLSGRPFTASVRQRTYVTRDGEQKVELFFHDAFLQEVGTKGKTLSADEFSLPDPGAQPIAEQGEQTVAAVSPAIVNAEV